MRSPNQVKAQKPFMNSMPSRPARFPRTSTHRSRTADQHTDSPFGKYRRFAVDRRLQPAYNKKEVLILRQ
jgi:hypothetical protein